MRKLLMPAGLILVLITVFSSIAFSYYNQAGKQRSPGNEMQRSSFTADETMWESVTKKVVGVLTVSFSAD